MKGQHRAWRAVGAHDMRAVTVTKVQGAFARAAVSCEDMTPLSTKPADQAVLPGWPWDWGIWSKRVAFPERGALSTNKVFQFSFIPLT